LKASLLTFGGAYTVIPFLCEAAASMLARSAGARSTTRISIPLAASVSAFQPDTDAAASPSAKARNQLGVGVDGANREQLEGVSRHLVPLTAAQLPDMSKDLDEDRAAGIEAVRPNFDLAHEDHNALAKRSP
jgi:hypothetical protein